VRVALDTNVLVSAVATRGLCADVVNLVLAEHELIVGETVLAKLRRVLAEKIRVPEVTIDEFVSLLRQEGTVARKAAIFPVKIRDTDDVPVLSEAIAGNADTLVTGDGDLLEPTAKLPLQILSPRGFWGQLRKNDPPK
jgi:putative PIN family toxin of toxin-antitoxin system